MEAQRPCTVRAMNGTRKMTFAIATALVVATLMAGAVAQFQPTTTSCRAVWDISAPTTDAPDATCGSRIVWVAKHCKCDGKPRSKPDRWCPADQCTVVFAQENVAVEYNQCARSVPHVTCTRLDIHTGPRDPHAALGLSGSS